MPELPEVETVRKILKRELVGSKIIGVKLYYDNLIAAPISDDFKALVVNQVINDVKRRGKWLMFELDDYYLLSHLRMEGKFNIVSPDSVLMKHEHISFMLSSGLELRYQDTRKFGRMYLVDKASAYDVKPLSELGLEPNDVSLSIAYLKGKYRGKRLPIKSVLLDQSIIVGIGNIYADEILFKSKLNPLLEAKLLTDSQLESIIINTASVLDNATKLGGTTIRTFTAGGVHGLFQNELMVHGKKGEPCPICGSKILKIKVGGRGTYYCPVCQK